MCLANIIYLEIGQENHVFVSDIWRSYATANIPFFSYLDLSRIPTAIVPSQLSRDLFNLLELIPVTMPRLLRWLKAPLMFSTNLSTLPCSPFAEMTPGFHCASSGRTRRTRRPQLLLLCLSVVVCGSWCGISASLNIREVAMGRKETMYVIGAKRIAQNCLRSASDSSASCENNKPKLKAAFATILDVKGREGLRAK
ncbi:hypothetical protein K438DRAFT_1964619 [Mycena galopus ATCC 62051]|nr:hypothetical protein K438DRAFT_1964619 [Mycena galopus ATCC 62051]